MNTVEEFDDESADVSEEVLDQDDTGATEDVLDVSVAEPNADASASEPERRPYPAVNKRLIRGSVAKVLELLEAESSDVNLLSVVLGITNASIGDVAVAVMTAKRADYSSLSDLKTIHAADPMEAGIIAVSLQRGALRGLWTVLASLDLVVSTLPASDAKAGMAVAKAIHTIDQNVLARVERVLFLARR